MAQITALIAGPNKNFDYQVTALARSILNQWVISWTDLIVSTNSVGVGEAFILCTRTGWQQVMVHYTNSASLAIDTTGTKYVWVGIDQSVIDDGSANAIDGTGIATIRTGSSYPTTGAYIPLASITGGVITDTRVFVTQKAITRNGFATGKTVYVDPNTGNEVVKNSTTSSTISGSDTMLMRDQNGDEKRVAYSDFGSLVTSSGKYVQTATMGETVASTFVSQTTTLPVFTLIHGWTTPFLVYSGSAKKFTSFSIYANYNSNATIFVKGSNDGGTTKTTLYTGSVNITTNSQTISLSGSSTAYSSIYFESSIPNISAYIDYITLIEDTSYTYTGSVPVSVVSEILYTNTLTTSAGANQTRIGNRYNFPYEVKLKKFKTWQTTVSTSASILILDNLGNTLKTVPMATVGMQEVDLDFLCTANTEYRVVLNDTANWTSGASYQYNTISNYQTSMPYVLGAVYGAWAGTLDNANGYIFIESTVDFQWRAYKSRANRVSEPQFAVFAGFVTSPKNIGDIVKLDANEGGYNDGLQWLTKWSFYYLSDIGGIISSTPGTIISPIGISYSTTALKITRSKTLGITKTVSMSTTIDVPNGTKTTTFYSSIFLFSKFISVSAINKWWWANAFDGGVWYIYVQLSIDWINFYDYNSLELWNYVIPDVMVWRIKFVIISTNYQPLTNRTYSPSVTLNF